MDVFAADKTWSANAVDARKALRAAWATRCDAEGYLSSKDLPLLLAAVKLTKLVGRAGAERAVPYGVAECNFVLEKLGLSPHDLARGGVLLRYATVERWYLAEVLGDRGDLRNALLVRAPVGLAKAGYHRLPPRSAPAFGAAPRPAAPVSVNALVHGEFALPSERGLDAFERTHFPGAPARPRSRPSAPAAAFAPGAVFGAVSAARTPAADVINGKFAVEGRPGTENAPERTYAPVEGARPPGRLPRPRHTRSSHALREASLFRLAHGPTADEAHRLPSLAYSKRLSAALGEDEFGAFQPRPSTIRL